MSRLVRLLALTLGVALSGSFSTIAQEPPRPGQETFISRAVFAEGQLWLLTDAGVLSSIAEGKDDRVEIPLPKPARDLWLQDGQPAVISCSRDSCTDWALRRRSSDGEWQVKARIPTQGDHFIAITNSGDTITVLTHQRIIDVVGDKQSALALSQHPTPRSAPFINATAHVMGTSVFVGFNAGEWGGGLMRIDRRTGEVVTVEHKVSGQFCYRPLDAECDPVHGIATAPWNQGCVVVAIGLVHFVPSGRIVEVCGNAIRQLYVKAHPPAAWWRPLPDQDAVAFFGLSRQSEALWAVGIDGIYRIASDGTARSQAFPAFKQIGGVSVSFDLPHFVLVLTQINRRQSVSGNAPMLVPR